MWWPKSFSFDILDSLSKNGSTQNNSGFTKSNIKVSWTFCCALLSHIMWRWHFSSRVCPHPHPKKSPKKSNSFFVLSFRLLWRQMLIGDLRLERWVLTVYYYIRKGIDWNIRCTLYPQGHTEMSCEKEQAKTSRWESY